MKEFWLVLAFLSGGTSLAPLYFGVRKMNFSASSYETTDVFVGGDAYNYIINAGHSTGCFILFGVCILLMLGFLILGYLQMIAYRGKEQVATE